MKVLHVTASLAPRYGGPSMALPEMCLALAERGHEVHLVSTNVDGRKELPVPTGKPLDAGGFTVSYYPVHFPRYYKASFGMARALVRIVPDMDIVHVHSLYLFHTAVSSFLCRRFDVPYVVRPHGTLDPYHRGRHRGRKWLYDTLIERRNLDRAAAIHYTSSDEHRHAEAAGVGAPGFVVPLGVDLTLLDTPGDMPTLLKEHPELRDRRLVTFLGRLTAKKGLDRLVDALSMVVRRVPGAHLVLAGPDDEGIGMALRERARMMGIGDRVSFLGFVSGAVKVGLLRATSAFALPSEDENFALAVVEALACGVPVVISDRVAIHQAISEHEAGLVVERSPETIARALVALLEDRDLAARCGARGRELARSQFGRARLGEALEDMYRAVLAGRATTGRPTLPVVHADGT